MTTISDAVRDALNAIQADIVATLPPVPETGTCTCGSTALRLIGEGFWQTHQITFGDNGTATVTFDGWDDISEQAVFSYIECGDCEAAYTAPDPRLTIWN